MAGQPHAAAGSRSRAGGGRRCEVRRCSHTAGTDHSCSGALHGVRGSVVDFSLGSFQGIFVLMIRRV